MGEIEGHLRLDCTVFFSFQNCPYDTFSSLDVTIRSFSHVHELPYLSVRSSEMRSGSCWVEDRMK